MKHALEVAKAGSLSKASEVLLIAAPNISRSIKELEADLGITIFDRTQSGMKLTPEGEEFLEFAESILGQIDQVENYYKKGHPKKQTFSISVPRASYICEAFAEFSKSLSKDAAEIFYKETNSQRTINNMLNHDYKLGIVRYAENYDMYFKTMLEEKGFTYELITEFTYKIIVSKASPLAKLHTISPDDLVDYIAIWCEYLNKCYLLSMKECDNKTNIYLRVDKPKNNSCISTITWAKDYEFIKKITNLKK